MLPLPKRREALEGVDHRLEHTVEGALEMKHSRAAVQQIGGQDEE